MNTLLRGSCLAVYFVALASLFIALPAGVAATVRYGALILLGAHVLEILVAFKSIRRYKGSLFASLVLTILFGFLHWLPLARENARAAK